MTIVHQLSGYNQRTETLEREIPVPAAHLGYVADVAGVDRDEDPGAIGSYPIPQDRLGQLADFLTEMWDRGNYDWFLEAFDDSVAPADKSEQPTPL